MNPRIMIALALLSTACGDFGDPPAPPSGSGSGGSGAGAGGKGWTPPPAGSGGSGAGQAGSPSGGTGGSGANAGSAGAGGSGPVPDGGSGATGSGDAGKPACQGGFASGASRCTVTDQHAECSHEQATIDGRVVYWQTPLGDPPAAGWPLVVVYQGSGFGPTVTWSGDPTMPFGGFNQVKLQAMLLDHGFIVVAPSANGVAWNTNFPGYELSSDAKFIPMLLDEIEKGSFGRADAARLYATGISSGGYMTSRMAVSYPGEFRALAIESGSYATCSNVMCTVPKPLPADHPPTLFLHGARDVAVPLYTAQAYHDQLAAQGIETEIIVDDTVGHGWLAVAPEEITCWFETH